MGLFDEAEEFVKLKFVGGIGLTQSSVARSC